MSVGKTKDAGWQIGVSKTVGRSAEDVWDFITSAAGVAIWLGEGVTVQPEPGVGYETADGIRGETRSFRDMDRIRLTWQLGPTGRTKRPCNSPCAPAARTKQCCAFTRNGWPMPPNGSSSAAIGREFSPN